MAKNNYDITIRARSGDEVTFWGSKFDDEGNEPRRIGYSGLSGLGEPERRTTSTVKSGADGGLVVARDQQYSSRIVSFTGFVMTRSSEELTKYRRAIARAMPIREYVQIFIAAPSGDVYGAQAVVSRCKTELVHSDQSNTVMDFDVDLICPDPLWQDYSSSDANQVRVTKVKPGGLHWGKTGLNWGGSGLKWSSGGSVPVATNNGSDVVYPTITIAGVVTSPVISNLTTGESIRIPIALGADDTLEIDMDNESIKLNGHNTPSSSIVGSWWGLIPGVNRLQYTSNNQSDTAQVIVSWRNRYTEVW